MRNTVQKHEILQYLKSVRTHPNADEVYKEVRKKIPTISLATVYRNLNVLAEQGEILRLDIDGEYRFDGHNLCHLHFACKRCGKIYDLHCEETLKGIKKNLARKGFSTDTLQIICRGICPNCKSKTNEV